MEDRAADFLTLSQPAIARFIKANRDKDVRVLALHRPAEAALWPWPLVLDQIQARQKGALKMPSWATVPGLIYPPSSLLEQASSEAMARYKANLCREWQGNNRDRTAPSIFVDLTAGAGIDTLALSGVYDKGIAIEIDGDNAARLRHNLDLLAPRRCDVMAMDANDAVPGLPSCALIYADPQRRDGARKGIFRLDSCSPAILSLLPACLAKAERVLVKTSPVLDIDLATGLLAPVESVHVVEWRGECREVLYAMRTECTVPPSTIAAVIDDNGNILTSFCFKREDEQKAPVLIGPPQRYLYEPSPAFMKAGCFKLLAVRFGLKQLHPHTHLYTGDHIVPAFPGRAFALSGIYGANGVALPLTRAHISVRNFPAKPDDLRKKWRLADGGDDYLFACTLEDGRKAVLHGRKIGGEARF